MTEAQVRTTRLGAAPGAKNLGEALEFSVVHQIPGRVRLEVPQIASDPHSRRGLEVLLRAVPGVKDVRTNPLAKSVVVAYDPQVLRHESLTGLLQRLKPGHLQAKKLHLRAVPHNPAAPTQPHAAGGSMHFQAEHGVHSGRTLALGSHGLHADAHASAGFAAEVDASYDATEHFGAFTVHAHLDEHLAIEVMAEADVHCIIAIDLAHHRHLEVDLGFKADARAVALSRGLAELDIEFMGWRLGVEGYLAFTAGEEFELAGWLTYHEGLLRVGAIAACGLVLSVEGGAGLLVGLPPTVQDALDELGQSLKEAFDSMVVLPPKRHLAVH